MLVITDFTPGTEFTHGSATYKVKETRYMNDYEGRDGWFVLAWRFVKTTKKYSGNAYLYQLAWLDEQNAKIINKQGN